MLVASPANPTGTMMTPEALAELIDVAEELGIRFISDEIYHGLDYAMPAETAARLSESAVVINSFSKYFCMTGWRVGWMVAPEPLVRPIDRLQGNLAISVPTLSQIAAAGGVRRPRRDGGGQARLRGEPPNPARRIAASRSRQIFAGRRRVLSLRRRVDASPTTVSISRAACWRRRHVAATPGVDFDPVSRHAIVALLLCAFAADMHEAVDRIGNWLGRR